uniref:3-cyclic-nucleotide phosphodiesterase n=1 Tax=Tetraselmis sp. GSL018 TaxID=582737 RepID=A0A061RJI1_9CHLO
MGSGREGAVVLLGSVLAAAVHDFRHPGVTNNFAVQTQMPVAKQFNDQSVLENQSLALSLSMLESEEAGIANRFSRERFLQLRAVIVSLVLATDMSRHFELVRTFHTLVLDNIGRGSENPMQFEKLSAGGTVLPNPWRALNKKQKDVTLQIALKVADIGHCALPHALHLQWVRRLEEEFFLQGDREAELQIPVSPLMDRDRPGPFDAHNHLRWLLRRCSDRGAACFPNARRSRPH